MVNKNWLTLGSKIPSRVVASDQPLRGEEHGQVLGNRFTLSRDDLGEFFISSGPHAHTERTSCHASFSPLQIDPASDRKAEDSVIQSPGEGPEGFPSCPQFSNRVGPIPYSTHRTSHRDLMRRQIEHPGHQALAENSSMAIPPHPLAWKAIISYPLF